MLLFQILILFLILLTTPVCFELPILIIAPVVFILIFLSTLGCTTEDLNRCLEMSTRQPYYLEEEPKKMPSLCRNDPPVSHNNNNNKIHNTNNTYKVTYKMRNYSTCTMFIQARSYIEAQRACESNPVISKIYSIIQV